ncbi:MAG: hypothetical protein O9283_11375 [Sphingomonadaceae bacterium]|nr:hypothetical protein [Sphingomonadaceae bacterium]
MAVAPTRPKPRGGPAFSQIVGLIDPISQGLTVRGRRLAARFALDHPPSLINKSTFINLAQSRLAQGEESDDVAA